MKIRDATIEDVPQMRKLWYELMNYHTEHQMVFRVKDGVEKLIEEDLKARIENSVFRFFICEFENQIGALEGIIRPDHCASLFRRCKSYFRESEAIVPGRLKTSGKW